MTAHARLSPSSASSWMVCADYPNAIEGLPDDESLFAFEGTVAHQFLEICLLLGNDPFDFVGWQTRHPTHDWVVTWEADDAENLQPIVDWIREQPGELYPEHRVNLSKWLGDNQFGTLDVGIVDTAMITILDLKYGRGVPVSPVENKQLRLYALGFIDRFAPHITDPKFPVRIMIEQPRNSDGGGTWTTTLGELQAFGETARAAAEATRLPNPPRTASLEGCYWCKRRQQEPSEHGAVTGCKTYDEFHLKLLQTEFDDLDGDELVLPRVDSLTTERQAFLYRHAASITKWVDQVKANIFDKAYSTGDAGGLKVVKGRAGKRKWVDEKSAEAAVKGLLGEKSFTKKLITPTQSEKLVSKEDYLNKVNPHVVRTDPSLTLVPVEDDRPAEILADEFDDF